MSITLDLWGLIAFGIGVWILMDGLVFGFMPETMRRLMEHMRSATLDDLRQAGLISAAIGAVIVFMIVCLPALD